ncbi:restriction endonuclease subunit S [Xanthobacter sp. KR7-225]|uniref:restriction endonuclease subunit S n=1 Tax=Xanthobacter sp. KR7-225 TaxID=3156613 RepID=UPI0032B48C49
MSGLPKGWIEAMLGQVTTKIGSGATPTGGEQSYRASGIPLVRSLNVHFDGVRSEGLAFLDERQAARLDNVIVETEDVLLNITGASIGRVAVAPKAYAGARVNQHVSIVRLAQGVLPQYVRGFLASPVAQEFIRRENYGATRQALTKSMIENFAFPLPPLAEQKRIVAKLDALNAKSARARTELARIETLVSRYKQAVLSKAFSGDLTREWRARVQVAEPRTGQLEELLSVPVRNGLSIKGSDTPPGFPALRLSALREREVRLDDVRYIPVNDDKARRFLLETGDVLVSRGNGTRSLVGIASIVPAIPRPTIFPDTAFRIRVDGTKALPLWLTSLWNAPQVRSQIEIVAKTTAGIWKISQKDLATIQLPIPSTLEEQHEIVRRIEAAFAKIDRLAAQARRALELVGKLDEAILAKAFRGELVPQDENDEPAEHLLIRIRAERQAAPKARRGRRAKA